MAVAAANNQSILTAHMQPLVSGTMLYPGNRCSLWQPVSAAAAAPVPVPVPVVAMPELPKESIIANTDFTTTSIIAKRRLSSKKRRLQHQTGSTGSDISTSESSTQSPTNSINGSPAIASASCTPREKMDVTDPFSHREEVAMVTSSSSQNNSEAGSSHINTAAAAIAGPGNGQFISVAPPTSHSATSNLIHSQIHNPAVLSQLQQGLNYRFLHEQSLLQQQAVGIQAPPPSRIEHPQPHTVNPQRGPSRSKSVQSGGSGSGFKWCVAHVITAKQIQQHKQQQSAGSPFQIYPKISHPKPHPQALPPTSTSFQSPPNQHQHHHHPAAHSHTPPSHPSLSSSASHAPPPHSTAITSAPPMPHYTLMQYSIPPNHPVAVTAAPAPPTIPPGYHLALPYSSLQDLQLLQQSQAMVAAGGPAHIQLNAGGIPVIKPMNVAEIGINGAGCGGMQFVGGVPLQQAQLAMAHGIPPSAAVTGVMPSSVGPSVGGLPIVNSCIMSNPFQAGIMAAPWVK